MVYVNVLGISCAEPVDNCGGHVDTMSDPPENERKQDSWGRMRNQQEWSHGEFARHPGEFARQIVHGMNDLLHEMKAARRDAAALSRHPSKLIKLAISFVNHELVL
jgi:hypothetical protein